MTRFFLRAAALATALAAVPSAALKAEAPLVAAPANPAMSQAEFHDLVVGAYWIDPKKQNDRAYLEAGSERLDGFWRRVLADKQGYAPLLAAELQRDGLPPNFYFDAPLLLVLAEKSEPMGQIAAAALLKVNFEKVGLNPGNYLLTANTLMGMGIDTTDVALHMLDSRAEEVIVSNSYHIFYYSKAEALVWMLFGMDEGWFVPKLAQRLQSETDDQNLAAIIHALWESVTPEGWAALRAYAEGPCKNKDACAYAREMLGHKGDAPPAEGLAAKDLRAKRRTIALNPFRHESYIAFHKLSDDLAAIAGPKL